MTENQNRNWNPDYIQTVFFTRFSYFIQYMFYFLVLFTR